MPRSASSASRATGSPHRQLARFRYCCSPPSRLQTRHRPITAPLGRLRQHILAHVRLAVRPRPRNADDPACDGSHSWPPPPRCDSTPTAAVVRAPTRSSHEGAEHEQDAGEHQEEDWRRRFVDSQTAPGSVAAHACHANRPPRVASLFRTLTLPWMQAARRCPQPRPRHRPRTQKSPLITAWYVLPVPRHARHGNTQIRKPRC